MAGKPLPSRRVTHRDIDFEERASGVPIDVRTKSGFPPPVPAGPEPFTYDPVKATAEHEREHPEGYRDFLRTSSSGKVGTLEDVLRLASASASREGGF